MNEVSLHSANHQLNAINLPVGGSMTKLQVYSLRYIVDRRERRNPLNTTGNHRHTYFEVHMPVTGEQTYQFGGQFVTVHAGEIIIIAPSVFHSIPHASEDLSKFTISFMLRDEQDNADNRWISKAFDNEKDFYFARAPQRLHMLFELIFEEAAQMEAGWINSIQHLVICLVRELARIAMPEHNAANDFHQKHEVVRRVEQTERFIRDNVASMLTCYSISEFMNLSVKQLNRDVRQVRGTSLRELVDTIKLAEAKRILCDKTKTREDAAMAIGFMDINSFNRFFKRKCGMTPGTYRQLREREDGEFSTREE